MTEEINKYLNKVNSELDYGLKCGCHLVSNKTNNLIKFQIEFGNVVYNTNISFGIEVENCKWDFLYPYYLGVFAIKSSNEYKDFLRLVKIDRIISNSSSISS